MRKSGIPLQNSGLAISSSKEEWWSQLPQETLQGRKSRVFKNQRVFVTAGSGFLLETDSEGSVSRYPISSGETLSSEEEIEIETFSSISISFMPIAGSLNGKNSGLLIKEILYSQMRRYAFERYCKLLGDVTTKLKNSLLFLVETGNYIQTEKKLVLPISHFELSEITGSPRETVTRSKKELEKRGFLVAGERIHSRFLLTEETFRQESERNPLLKDLATTIRFVRLEMGLEKRANISSFVKTASPVSPAKKSWPRKTKNIRHATEPANQKEGNGMPLCPVFNQPITQVAARNCMEEGKVFARRVRCIAVQCASPNRLCIACVDQGATAHGKNTEGCFVKDPVSGLCEDHMKHGKKWHKENLLIVAKETPVTPASSSENIPATKEDIPASSKESEEKKMSGKRIPNEIIDAVLAWNANHPPEETRTAFAKKIGIKDARMRHILKTHGAPTATPIPPQKAPAPPISVEPITGKPAWHQISEVSNAASRINTAAEKLNAMSTQQMCLLSEGNLKEDRADLYEKLISSRSAHDLLIAKLKP